MSPDAMLTPEIRGWCPGAYAPMASNDGLLIRPKIIGARLTGRQAQAIAEIAAECGNGAIDLSQRAQLQIRGVREETREAALRKLDAAGLLPPSAAAERITNIVASPLAGLTLTAFDANALAEALAAALQRDPALSALPAKFLFLIDDGGPLPLDDAEADIRIEAAPNGMRAIRAAGMSTQAIIVAHEDAVPTALALARVFIALRKDRESEWRRMRSLVKATGVDKLLGAASLTATDYAPAPRTRGAIHGAKQIAGLAFCGVSMPFGRWLARDLATAAEFALNEGLGELRLTPWRTIIIPTKSAEAASRVSLLARVHGFINSSEDLRLAVVACPGAPECPQALGPTRNILSRVAALAHELAGADGIGVHISGCAKGCVRPGVTPVTLLVTPQGYDIIDNGRADGQPARQALELPAVVQELAARAAEKTP